LFFLFAGSCTLLTDLKVENVKLLGADDILRYFFDNKNLYYYKNL